MRDEEEQFLINSQYPITNDYNMHPVKLRITVKPQSKREGIFERDGMLVVAVTEPARDGRANEAVRRALAKHFHVPVRAIKILGGLSSRQKWVSVEENA